MLTLAQAVAYLKSDPADNAVVADLLPVVEAAFRVESKRRWPAVGERALTVAVDPLAVPIVLRFVAWVDPAALSPDEQIVADQWMRFTLGHYYENRQTVAVGLNMTEVPETARKLMNLLRSPTI